MEGVPQSICQSGHVSGDYTLALYDTEEDGKRCRSSGGAGTDYTRHEGTNYGIGNWYYYNGDRERAREIFQEIVDGPGWGSFAAITAEADLAKRGRPQVGWTVAKRHTQTSRRRQRVPPRRWKSGASTASWTNSAFKYPLNRPVALLAPSENGWTAQNHHPNS